MAPRKTAVVTINPLFKLLIVINSALCVICLAVMLAIGFKATEPMPKIQEQLYGACETVFKMTAGAFIGLLGGRAAAPDSAQQDSLGGEGLMVRATTRTPQRPAPPTDPS